MAPSLMTRFLVCLLPLLLLLLLLPPAAAAAKPSPKQQPLAAVACPATQTTFVATTELVFESTTSNDTSPSSFLQTEMDELKVLLTGVYNGLAETKCDSYFRRIQTMTMITTNRPNNGTTTTMDGMMRRSLQTDDNINATNLGDRRSNELGVVYEVTGTCRDCPVTPGGAFELYDDSFRRRRLLRGVRVRRVTTRLVSSRTRTLQDESSNDDCQCLVGQQPTRPQAPGVRECVDQMNVEIDELQQEQPNLYAGVLLTDLLQLDDLNKTEAPPQEVVETGPEEDAPSWGYGDLVDGGSTVTTTFTPPPPAPADEGTAPSWRDYGY